MKKTALALIALIPTLPAFGWGQKGHDTTAHIAERHLTPTARAAVEELIDGHSIVYYANWMDNASHTDEYAYTKTWHYKNIDEGLDFDEAPKIPEGDIVRALDQQIKLLSDPNASKDERSLALKMVVHFLGDLHQPMHMGRASDRGGNSHHVKFFNRDTNLHSSWDSSLPEAAHKWSYSEWAEQLDRLTPEQQAAIAAGNPESWAKETYGIAKDVYAGTPEGTKISYDYISEWTPTVEQAFLKGGIRLAHILNTVFDPEYANTTE